MKKLLVSVLCVVMVMVFMPTMAFAATNAFEVTKADGSNNTYATAEEAIASVKTGETATIKLLSDYTGNGIKVGLDYPVNVTFDLNGKTWDVTGTVGSTGTETNGFQLLKGSTVKFMNGKVVSKTAKIMFQNYCDLTLENVEATINTVGKGFYVSSNNNGSTTVINSKLTISGEGNYAIDSDCFASYDGGKVTVDSNSTLSGDVSVTNGGMLSVSGTVNGNVYVTNYGDDAHSKKTAVFKAVDGAAIEGNILAEKNGAAEVSGAAIFGDITVSGADAKVDFNSGAVLGKIGEGVKVNNDFVAEISDGVDAVKVVGKAQFDNLVEEINKGIKDGTLNAEDFVITIKNAPEGTKIENLPEGVKVTNNSENKVVVNGNALEKGKDVVVTAPVTTPTTPTTPAPAPQTGDSNAMASVMSLIALAGLTVVLIRKRKEMN